MLYNIHAAYIVYASYNIILYEACFIYYISCNGAMPIKQISENNTHRCTSGCWVFNFLFKKRVFIFILIMSVT